MLKKLHRASLHVVNLASNQNQKMQLKSSEPITANQHHKPANHAPKKSSHTQPQKSHTQQ
jgi:hypothetical protein